jgi:UDP-N-acetylglucosamine diphosphorylase / glucose-1-phosphate thymidylyltransferase / UDP-N-acetylgalactosamine diphosphorylase / glucosamine-1-phosphate N-acetyltransferase / galactosamine-1-phosphate N-acetyltransferase
MSQNLAILVAEDDSIGLLHPVVTARPGYAISCATFRLIDWLRLLGAPVYGDVRPHLREIQDRDFGVLAPPEMYPAGASLLFVNARFQVTPKAR